MRPGTNNTLEVIETCGNSPFPLRFFIRYGVETGLQTPRDTAYPYQSVGVARSKSGKLIGGVRHQFKDTSNGTEAKLVIEFPALTPAFIVKEHQIHLACEFSSWILMSLLPNILFGFVPYLIGMLFPQLVFFLVVGTCAIGMGVGDYYNVFNALTQMPKGSRTYLYKFNSFWYLPKII